MSDMDVTQKADHVLIKRGLYYRPDGNGYTGLKSEAGLYPPAYANDLERVSAVPFEEAPDFAPACFVETKITYLRAEVERLRGALIQCGRAAGAGIADTVSTDFLMLVPREVEAKIAALRARP